jgi:hypothetical protein
MFDNEFCRLRKPARWDEWAVHFLGQTATKLADPIDDQVLEKI